MLTATICVLGISNDAKNTMSRDPPLPRPLERGGLLSFLCFFIVFGKPSKFMASIWVGPVQHQRQTVGTWLGEYPSCVSTHARNIWIIYRKWLIWRSILGNK